MWFATNKDQLHAIVDDNDHLYRLFTGYSGWGEGQLDGEMRAGGWLTTPADARLVFEVDDEEVWQRAASRIGGDILRADRRIKNVPDDPSLN